jgi:hypothetical protein
MRTHVVRYEGVTLNVVGKRVCGRELPIPTTLTSQLEEILVGDELPDVFDPEPWYDPDKQVVF